MGRHKSRRVEIRTSWDPVADWYAGWVGREGSEHHRRLAIPAVLRMLTPAAGEELLDIGCGPGVLAPHIARAGARYTGIDASARLLAIARRYHGQAGRFLQADATRLAVLPELGPGAFDAAVFLLSLQDIEPLEAALESAAWALRREGRLVLLLTHPCFRIPRQSGWGWDEGRRLHYRRIDSYLSRLAIPMKAYGARRQGVTRSYHRPLGDYVNGMAANDLLVDCIQEIPADGLVSARRRNRDEPASREIPLFLGLRAVKR